MMDCIRPSRLNRHPELVRTVFLTNLHRHPERVRSLFPDLILIVTLNLFQGLTFERPGHQDTKTN